MKILILSIILLQPSLLPAEDILQGVVAEENEKGEVIPLIGVNVYWQETTIAAATDANGVFSIECRHETHPLVISYIGYEPDTIHVENHDYITIILKKGLTLKEVEVTYRKKSTEVSYADVIKTQEISEQELFKAACCNLSESFETTPSVDVSFSDAVTGTKQIQMLGLAGAYTVVSQENVPYLRGLASGRGLGFIPGTWIESIQLSKGTGSVVNGFESFAGTINVELKRPENSEKLYLNAFVNQEGRMEGNLNFANRIAKKWRTATLLHGSVKPFEWDLNDDGFLDFPKSYAATGLHRWRFDNYKGIESEFGVKGLREDHIGGQNKFDLSHPRDTLHPYGVRIETNRVELFAKVGYVFAQKRYKSMGLQLSGSWHDMKSFFGLRDYDATQYSFYSNLIYQSIIVSTQNKFKTGVSYQYDRYDERLDSADYQRNEQVPGAFFEYTFTHLDKITLVAGIRADYNNIYGFFATPRLHARFALAENTVLRLSAGRGQRTANIISENMGLLATSRKVVIVPNNDDGSGFRLDPEVAWNYGVNISQHFKLWKRDGTFSVDFYRTDFQNQVVIDLDNSPQEILFYNLQGKSYSNSLQAQIDHEVLKNFDVRLAYRWYDVNTSFTKGLLQKPLLAGHRAFMNLAYRTGKIWKFDFTVQWQSKKRIPYTASNPERYRLDEYSPDFFLLNAQITKVFKKGVEVYIGMENIASYTQDDPILASDMPFSPYFDSALIWGPIFGRTAYAGFRYRIGGKRESSDN